VETVDLGESLAGLARAQARPPPPRSGCSTPRLTPRGAGRPQAAAAANASGSEPPSSHHSLLLLPWLFGQLRGGATASSSSCGGGERRRPATEGSGDEAASSFGVQAMLTFRLASEACSGTLCLVELVQLASLPRVAAASGLGPRSTAAEIQQVVDKSMQAAAAYATVRDVLQEVNNVKPQATSSKPEAASHQLCLALRRGLQESLQPRESGDDEHASGDANAMVHQVGAPVGTAVVCFCAQQGEQHGEEARGLLQLTRSLVNCAPAGASSARGGGGRGSSGGGEAEKRRPVDELAEAEGGGPCDSPVRVRVRSGSGIVREASETSARGGDHVLRSTLKGVAQRALLSLGRSNAVLRRVATQRSASGDGELQRTPPVAPGVGRMPGVHFNC